MFKKKLLPDCPFCGANAEMSSYDQGVTKCSNLACVLNMHSFLVEEWRVRKGESGDLSPKFCTSCRLTRSLMRDNSKPSAPKRRNALYNGAPITLELLASWGNENCDY